MKLLTRKSAKKKYCYLADLRSIRKEMIMKRLTWLLVAVMLVVTLAACSKTTDPAGSGNHSTRAESKTPSGADNTPGAAANSTENGAWQEQIQQGLEPEYVPGTVPGTASGGKEAKHLSLSELKGTWYNKDASYGLWVRQGSDGWAINYFTKTEYYRADSDSAYDPSSGKLALTSSDGRKGTFSIVVIDSKTIRIVEDDVILTRQPD